MASPLYDIYDPDGELRRQAKLRQLLTGQRQNLSVLLPEEEKSSMLRQLANVGASGISAAGWLLDTPGAVVRGALSGGPGKAISALWEGSEDRVTGRDLARQYGLVGEEDTWLNFAGGLAAEMALDPLTYVNPFSILGRGAYTTSGKALARSGLLEDAALMANRNQMGIREFLRKNTADDIIDAYSAGDAARRAKAVQDFSDAAGYYGADANDLLGQAATTSLEFRVPFTKRGVSISPTGGRAGDIVARGLDNLGEALKYNAVTGPIVNRARAFFDPSVIDAVDPDQQWRNREAFSTAREGVRQVYEDTTRLQSAALNAKPQGLPDELSDFTSRRIQNAIGDLVESGFDTSKIIDVEAADAVLNTPEWDAVARSFASSLESSKLSAMDRGLKLRRWKGEGGTEFFPSQSVWFDVDKSPDLPNRIGRQQKRYTKGSRALNVEDNLGRQRDPAYDLQMRRQALRQLMGRDESYAGKALQDTLNSLGDDDAILALEDAYRRLDADTGGKMGRLYGSQQDTIARLDQRIADLTTKMNAANVQPAGVQRYQKQIDELIARRDKVSGQIKQQKGKLVDLLRRADTQFAENKMGLFDRNPFEDMLRYQTGRAKTEANADAIIKSLIDAAQTSPGPASVIGGGAVPLTKAASELGFDPSRFRKMLAAQGIDADVANVNERLVASLKQLTPPSGIDTGNPFTRLSRSYTNLWKMLTLANPSYHARNLYSGLFASLSQDGTNPISLIGGGAAGWRAARGNYGPLLARVRKIPRYQRVESAFRAINPSASQEAIDNEILKEFFSEFSRNRIAQNATVTDVAGASAAGMPQLVPGAKPADRVPWVGKGGLLYDNDRSWRDWFTVRGVDFGGTLSDRQAPQVTLNPLLNLHERTAQSVEDFNRLGTYIAALESGMSPDAAAKQVFRSQVDYSADAFTAAERRLRGSGLVPFYSYPKGIAPLVFENMLYNPAGIQGKSIRAISRAGEGNEDFFVPEDLRQSAAIPTPGGPENENLQRFYTNIDLPYAGLLNLYSPGVGNTFLDRTLDSVKRTGINLAGNLNPLPKFAIENLFGKRLYDGRDLTDLFSVFERDLGEGYRPLENIVASLVPAGSRGLALYRTATDDRLTPAERFNKLVVNNLTGIKVKDIDQERTKQIAARNALNQLLKNTAGASTYENISVPDEELIKMSPEDRQLYLLYRVMQSDAARAARERKKQELNPVDLLMMAQ